MLTNLKIENVAVIEKAEVNFNAGFTVLTGETGAGKSIPVSYTHLDVYKRQTLTCPPGNKSARRHGTACWAAANVCAPS